MFAPTAMTVLPATWDGSLPGKWTYRSYLNRADIIVGDDPDPAVRNLAAMFGQGSTANNAAKALSLVFGEGVMTFDPPSDNNVTGTFDMYDYRANSTPKWPNGVNQVPTLVGTVIRAKPHDGGAAGVVASFIAIKR
jgi:hypothetical protein